ncbi:trigger factor [Acidocella aminolytica]|uniref:Trigger factor n=1 Tax=Acidocella aminolytica 101 = DSM 11237 TaxID=1120923 RepID=A0A0D6PEG4_9PROT|nr:trigger factor [Acidocella aminolytica]GAN79731.1 peptidyl-prolyl cis-trans isomerase trigger factor [Acidocella aminolytica 101 = DSM 11237]GBQ39877.1 peptidyl-prolyl cis-trans isomerase trigger factor [Acidocella aminolytica 101 = DSM 11237]SHE72597.1 trigger factor [Acidocella aminolytica 101 = DSM 11237]
MQVTETLSDGLKRGFTVVVPEPELAAKREKRLAELSKTIQMPGFRPGKVPMNIVRKRYGEAVAAEIVEGAVNEAHSQLLSERNLRPAMQPKLEIVKPGTESDLEFTVEMEILPEVTIPDLADVSLSKPVAAVSDEKLDEALKNIAEQRKSFAKVEEERPAAAGEQLKVDFVGKIDGVAFEGGTAEDVALVVAGPGFIPGFTEQVEGMKVGETKIITVTFPEDYGAKDLAGKTAEFEITAKELAVAEVPAIDDELGKAVGLEGLEQLKERVKEQIGNEYAGMTRSKLKRALLDVLADKAQFEAPVSLVDAEFDAIWGQVQAEKEAGEQDPEDAGKDEETLKAEYKAIADRRVRLGLLVAEIGRANDVQVTDQELQRAMFNEAMRYGPQAMQVVEFFRKNPQQMERFRGPIFEDKVIDHLLGSVKQDEVEVSAEELAKDPEA